MIFPFNYIHDYDHLALKCIHVIIPSKYLFYSILSPHSPYQLEITQHSYYLTIILTSLSRLIASTLNPFTSQKIPNIHIKQLEPITSFNSEELSPLTSSKLPNIHINQLKSITSLNSKALCPFTSQKLPNSHINQLEPITSFNSKALSPLTSQKLPNIHINQLEPIASFNSETLSPLTSCI